MNDLFTAIEQAECESKRAAFASDPSILERALPRYMAILREFDELMRTNKVAEACELENRVDELVIELQGDTFGCLCDDGAAHRLCEATAANPGTVPMWGQKGEFVANLSIYKVRFEYDGLVGIGGPFSFKIHAVEFDRPFFSETGYRSFMGNAIQSVPEGATVDAVLVDIVRQYANRELKGKYPFICQENRPCKKHSEQYCAECRPARVIPPPVVEPEPDYDRCEDCGELLESCEEDCICEPELEPEPELEDVEPVSVEAFTSTEQLSLF